MNPQTELRKSLTTLAAHLTPQAHTKLVETARNNRLAVELQQWVVTLSPGNVTALLELVDLQERQLKDIALNTVSPNSVTGKAPVAAKETIQEEIEPCGPVNTEKATSKPTASVKGDK